jgi:hypothetical protein
MRTAIALALAAVSATAVPTVGARAYTPAFGMMGQRQVPPEPVPVRPKGVHVVLPPGFELRACDAVDLPVDPGDWSGSEFGASSPMPGLSVDSRTGRITGTPSAAPGTAYVLQVWVGGEAGVLAASEKTVLTLRPCPPR